MYSIIVDSMRPFLESCSQQMQIKVVRPGVRFTFMTFGLLKTEQPLPWSATIRE